MGEREKELDNRWLNEHTIARSGSDQAGRRCELYITNKFLEQDTWGGGGGGGGCLWGGGGGGGGGGGYCKIGGFPKRRLKERKGRSCRSCHMGTEKR